MIKAIKFASVPVTDQDRALDFYTTQLGFKVLTDQPYSDDVRWIELGIPKAQTALVLFTLPGHEDRVGTFTGISFLAEDVEATARELKSRGVEFVQDPQQADWGTSAVFRDPDGNQFVLSSK